MRFATATASAMWSTWPCVSRMWVGSTSSAVTVAFGLFGARNGSTGRARRPRRARTSRGRESGCPCLPPWGREGRVTGGSWSLPVQLARKLPPHGDADHHPDAASPRRAACAAAVEPLVRVLDRRRSSPAPARAAASNQPPSASAVGEHLLELRRRRRDAPLGLAESARARAAPRSRRCSCSSSERRHRGDNKPHGGCRRTASDEPFARRGLRLQDRPGRPPGAARASCPRRATRRCWSARRPRDDAGVYRVTDELALVQTVDFFTPIVDDPYDFGRIAAANALSDVYAMGARPVTALNLVAFSLEQLGAETLAEILRGGADDRGARRASRSSAATRSTTRSRSTAWRSPASSHPERVVRNSTARRRRRASS